jgi:hypothetical protein
MATIKSLTTSTTQQYDEILSATTTPILTDDTDNIIQADYDLTNFLLFLFPLYILAILFNFLSIYSILIAKIYRQYLSNVLLAVICIGSLFNVHGQMFLVLLRWTNNSASNQLCSSSYYLRDSGSILIHTHILLLTFERILANMKKNMKYLNNNLIQKAHFFLIIISLISILLSLTIPIYTFNHSLFSSFDGLCIPLDVISYKKYLNWIYYGFGHSFLWLPLIILLIFLFNKTTISYSTLIPMNRIILFINLLSCINILIQTLFDDIIGIGNERPLKVQNIPSQKLFYLMNLRDYICIVQKVLIGLTFFLFRPEIRLWFMESMKKFQSNKKEPIIPQMLEIRNDSEENYDVIDDGNIQFRADN